MINKLNAEEWILAETFNFLPYIIEHNVLI